MKVYCWQSMVEDIWHLSLTKPETLTEDIPEMKLKAGDIKGVPFTVLAKMPKDFQSRLPHGKELREMLFHEDLWGRAKELPSYDKKFWILLQQMLGV